MGCRESFTLGLLNRGLNSVDRKRDFRPAYCVEKLNDRRLRQRDNVGYTTKYIHAVLAAYAIDATRPRNV